MPERREEPALEGDYSTRGCLAHVFTGLIVSAVGYASGHAFEYVIHLVPRISLGAVMVSTGLLKYVVVMPALLIVMVKAYRPYVRWLLRIGWLRERTPRQDRREET